MKKVKKLKKAKINSYLKNKCRIRDKAIEWQLKFGEKDYSYYELAIIQEYFLKQGERYGLLKEFRENGII